jgi:protein-L-isoaspartate(D-aspartate) O-methyltransferase
MKAGRSVTAWVAVVLALMAAAGCRAPRARMGPEAMRKDMVSRFVKAGYVTDPRVIEAMGEVPREEFVPEDYRDEAYLDTPLPIGYNQTISAPSIVAMMTELLEPTADATVLEVGTGSGYQAAVLAKLVKHVYSIEILPQLAREAAARLKRMGYGNVSVKAGDGYKGWREHAPFDGIIVTCAPEKVPAPLVEQLKEGGRMVIPVGGPWQQELYLLRKEHGKIVKRSVVPVMFVPMTGEVEKGKGKE